MQKLSFIATPIVRTKMLKDGTAMLKAANLITRALNAALFPVRFECQMSFTDEGLRATVYGSDSFDPLEVQRVLFGNDKSTQEETMF